MNPLYNIDLALLKKQKLELVMVIAEILDDADNNLSSENKARVENLEGLLNLMDAVQDYVEDNNLEK